MKLLFSLYTCENKGESAGIGVFWAWLIGLSELFTGSPMDISSLKINKSKYFPKILTMNDISGAKIDLTF